MKHPITTPAPAPTHCPRCARRLDGQPLLPSRGSHGICAVCIIDVANIERQMQQVDELFKSGTLFS